MLTRYYGSNLEYWFKRQDFDGPKIRPFGAGLNPYVIFIADGNAYSLSPETGKMDSLEGLGKEYVANAVKSGEWKRFKLDELKNFYKLDIFYDKNELAAFTGVIKTLSNAVSLLSSPTNEIITKKPMSVIGQQPQSNIADATPRVVARGQLYYNLAEKQVQRIIEVQGHLYWASYHKQSAKPYGIKSFRKATKAEVDYYLANAS